ncbi:MAG: methyltransferase domain-containing protein [Planctomycetales bacterium]|nr:methyltransferase domain-containing protein [Planctomycetales bacterium]
MEGESPPPDDDAEFGVPFPGRVLPRESWTRTRWRDTGGAFDWAAAFGRDGARVVDLGCGNGRFLIGSALARPEVLHLGIDLVQVALDYAAQRANRRGLANVRFVVGDVVAWIFERLAPGSVDEIHIYHPQPYYQEADRGRRLLTPEFLERAWAVLRPSGKLVVQTDNKAYWGYLRRALEKHFERAIHKGPWPDAPQGRTRREIEARRRGLVVWRMQARRRDEPLPIEIALPDFDANRPKYRRRARG